MLWPVPFLFCSTRKKEEEKRSKDVDTSSNVEDDLPLLTSWLGGIQLNEKPVSVLMIRRKNGRHAFFALDLDVLFWIIKGTGHYF